MSYSDTFDSLCVLLEEYADADIETVANQILGMFGVLGEDLLEHLDPPLGLTTWLRSHGLSLLRTTEARSPKVWEAAESEVDEEDTGDLEGEPSEELPLQVGEYVEYRTAPHGRDHMIALGSGWLAEIDHANGFAWVDPGDRPQVYIDMNDGDVIRRIPESSSPQTAPAPPS